MTPWIAIAFFVGVPALMAIIPGIAAIAICLRCPNNDPTWSDKE